LSECYGFAYTGGRTYIEGKGFAYPKEIYHLEYSAPILKDRGIDFKSKLRDKLGQYYDILELIHEDPAISWNALKVKTRIEAGDRCEKLVEELECKGLVILNDEGSYITDKGMKFLAAAFVVIKEMRIIRLHIAETRAGLRCHTCGKLR